MEKSYIFDFSKQTMFNTQNTAVLKASKVISDFFNPLTALLVFFIYYSYLNYTPKETLHKFLPIFLIMILPISGWIIYNVKTGKYSNMDVSNREQRKSLYNFIAMAMAFYLVYDFFVNRNLDVIMLFILVLLILMHISNYFIKSSMHTAFNVLTAAFFYVLNPLLGLLWFIIAVLVGITRIILKRHIPKEVLMGGALALLVSFAYLYTTIQINH